MQMLSARAPSDRRPSLLTTGHQQGGFTFIEIMVVLTLLGAVAIATGYTALGRMDNAKAQLAIVALTEDIPRAMFAYLESASVPREGARIEDEMAARGIRPTTPWDEPWRAIMRGSGLSARVEVRYPVQGDDPNLVARRISEKLSDSSAFPQFYSSRFKNRTLVVQYALFSEY